MSVCGGDLGSVCEVYLLLCSSIPYIFFHRQMAEFSFNVISICLLLHLNSYYARLLPHPIIIANKCSRGHIPLSRQGRGLPLNWVDCVSGDNRTLDITGFFLFVILPQTNYKNSACWSIWENHTHRHFCIAYLFSEGFKVKFPQLSKWKVWHKQASWLRKWIKGQALYCWKIFLEWTHFTSQFCIKSKMENCLT